MNRLIVLVVVGILTLCRGSVLHSEERATAETAIAALDKPVTLNANSSIPLKKLLDQLSEHAGVVFDVDERAFRELEPPVDRVVDVSLETPRFRGQSLRVALRIALKPIGGEVLVREGFLEITTLREVHRCTNQLHHYYNEIDEYAISAVPIRTEPVLSFIREKTPLVEVVRFFANVTGANILITNNAAARARTPISLRLLNVRLDQALHAAAEMAGLRMVRRENVYYVTTREHAAELERQIGGPEVVHLQRRIRALEVQSQLLVNELIRMQRANNTIRPVEYAPGIPQDRR